MAECDSLSNGFVADKNDFPTIGGSGQSEDSPEINDNGDAVQVWSQSNWAEVVKKKPTRLGSSTEAKRSCGPFNFVIKVPTFDDLRKQIRLAKAHLDDKTKARDAIQLRVKAKIAECQIHADRFGSGNGEHKTASNLVKSKRMQIESLQSLIKKGKNASAIDQINSRVRDMERRMQNETLSSKEEHKLIRKITEQNELRGKLLSTFGSEDDIDEILEQRDEEAEENRLEILRKELDILKKKALEAQANAVKLEKRCDEERKKIKELQARFRDADEVRKSAYAKWQSLTNELQEKTEYFSKYKDDVILANKYADKKDKMALHRLCMNNVENFMKAWNGSDEFRKEYIRIRTNTEEGVSDSVKEAENVISEGEKVNNEGSDDRELIDEVAKESTEEIESTWKAGEIDIASETEQKQETSTENVISDGEKATNEESDDSRLIDEVVNESTDEIESTGKAGESDIESETEAKQETSTENKGENRGENSDSDFDIIERSDEVHEKKPADQIESISTSLNEVDEADEIEKQDAEERHQKKREKRRRHKKGKKERDVAAAEDSKEKKQQFYAVILSLFLILLLLWLH